MRIKNDNRSFFHLVLEVDENILHPRAWGQSSKLICNKMILGVCLLSPRKPAPRVASLHECTLLVHRTVAHVSCIHFNWEAWPCTSLHMHCLAARGLPHPVCGCRYGTEALPHAGRLLVGDTIPTDQVAMVRTIVSGIMPVPLTSPAGASRSARRRRACSQQVEGTPAKGAPGYALARSFARGASTPRCIGATSA
ncbi:hypothetical protein EVAR_30351_1 [Eumeta japonica]|uniref:Uncharacterized protein n=1 Tax=Eumeta variegata TaxID=151549 RepID=A0A4C2A7N3_EUMVA|nr:hypothetical protein EVAR_30351_1 [Eumeta japonica]